jgi:hypothetical protein
LTSWVHFPNPRIVSTSWRSWTTSLKMGRSITLSSHQCKTRLEDVSWDHLPPFWSTLDGHKWWGVTLYRQDLSQLPGRTWCMTQDSHTLPSADQCTSWNIK